MEWMGNIPKDFLVFFGVSVFSLVVGLEQRGRHTKGQIFGRERTYALVGILGYVLYVIDPVRGYHYMGGGAALTFFLGIFYWQRMEKQNKYGLTSIVTVLIIYGLTPLLYAKPFWVTACVVTVVILLLEAKEELIALSGKFDDDEFITVAKFLAMSGIILPLLPRGEIATFLPLSPFKIWLVVVVVSSVSYLSYLLKKFIFPDKGLLITGVLGGLYSSTATTVVLARKSKEVGVVNVQVAAAIILATAMMFIRIFALIVIFNPPLAGHLVVSFAVLTVLSLLLAWLVLKHQPSERVEVDAPAETKNPLEFKTALLFGALFMFFAMVTQWVLQVYGAGGLHTLAVIVGVTDIDPFLMSLFTGSYAIGISHIASATLIAISSNNIMKLVYAVTMGDKSLRKPLIGSFLLIVATAMVVIFFLV